MGAVMRDGPIGSPVHAAPGRRHGRSIRAALVSIALLRLNKELITPSTFSISSVEAPCAEGATQIALAGTAVRSMPRR